MAFAFARSVSSTEVPAARTNAGPEGLTKCQPKFDTGHSGNQRFLEILNGFYEVGLPKDQVEFIWVVDLDGLQIHFSPSKENAERLVRSALTSA